MDNASNITLTAEQEKTISEQAELGEQLNAVDISHDDYEAMMRRD